MVMTTTIGAFPKPDYVPISDWFSNQDGNYTGAYLDELAAAGDAAEELLDRATREVVQDQVRAGIDIPTDGEVRRENYVHYLCRSLSGINFKALAQRRMRGTTNALLPTIVGPIQAGDSPLVRDWQTAQAATDRTVKMTLPGPLTIADSTVDYHYRDQVALGAALADAIGHHVLALADAGCRHIQIDEPLMARQPREALEYGIEQLARCFDGVGDGVTRTVHVCCGYPNELDEVGYPKAPLESYLELAPHLDRAPFDAVSIEDAHRHNDLELLLPLFSETIVILGVVAVAKSRIETEQEIIGRLRVARAHIDADRLIAAPDCGLGYLSRTQALQKLQHMTDAAHSVR